MRTAFDLYIDGRNFFVVSTISELLVDIQMASEARAGGCCQCV